MVPGSEYEQWGRSRWEGRPAEAVRQEYPAYDENYHVQSPLPPPDQQWGYAPPPHYQYPPHIQARAPMPTYHPPPHEPTRRLGQWTREEEAYAEKVAALFKTGRVPNCPEGLTMRALLADLLNCAPMRVSKKFSGERAIGKCSYKRVQEDLSKEEADLKPLEEAFHRSLRGVGHLKMSLAHTSGLITPVEAARNPHHVDVGGGQGQADQKPVQPPMGYHPYVQDHRVMAGGYPHYSRSPPPPPPPRPMPGHPMSRTPLEGGSWVAQPPNGSAYRSGDPRAGAPHGYLSPPGGSSSAASMTYSRQPMPPLGGPPLDDGVTVSVTAPHGHPTHTASLPPHDVPYQTAAHDPSAGIRPSKMARYVHAASAMSPPQGMPQHGQPQGGGYQLPPSNPPQMPPSAEHWMGGYPDERQMPEPQPQSVDPSVRYD